MVIKEVLRLVSPGAFMPCFEYEDIDADPNKVIVKPQVISICAADQRYFNGTRPQNVIDQKLPMALIHEALGTVLYDPQGKIEKGSLCVLIPIENHEHPESNYLPLTRFRSSNCDGFCQELMGIEREEIIVVGGRDTDGETRDLYVFTELVSVCTQALNKVRSLEGGQAKKNPKIAVMGDGPMAFLMALVCRHRMPKASIHVIGKHDSKLARFSFADKLLSIYSKGGVKDSHYDICFECVGGSGAQSAVTMAEGCTRPCGKIVLMGVSENRIAVNTRLILEKGLTLTGTSRSTKKDFTEAASLISKARFAKQLKKIVSACYQINDHHDLENAFINDINNPFKTMARLNL